MKSNIKFISATRTNFSTVSATYKLNDEEFKLFWSNVDETQVSKYTNYDLILNVESKNSDLSERISHLIQLGESNENLEDLEIYIYIRDSFAEHSLFALDAPLFEMVDYRRTTDGEIYFIDLNLANENGTVERVCLNVKDNKIIEDDLWDEFEEMSDCQICKKEIESNL